MIATGAAMATAPTSERWRTSQRRACQVQGSRQAVTGSLASHRSTSSASAFALG